MAQVDKKRSDYDDTEHKKLTSIDLQNILEVNRKAIEIHIEVEKQNEDIIESLDGLTKKVEDIDKNLFKLVIALGGIGVAVISEFLQVILSHR